MIGAGFGRTGTDSMREALNILGFGPCHHMFEVTANPVQRQRWRAMVAGEAPDWEALFQGYASCIDVPAAWYWREITAVWPEAPVDPDASRQRELVAQLRSHGARVRRERAGP